MQKLNRDEGRTFVLVLHELAQARRVSHRIVALKGGRVMASGTPEEVLVPSVLEEVFDVPFDDQGPVPGVALGTAVAPGLASPLEARALSGGYRGVPVFGPIDLTMGPGGLIALVGANGSGKSMFLRTLAGLQRPVSGEAWLGGRPVGGRRPRELARDRSFVRQDTPLPTGFTVAELVDLGHYHRRGPWSWTGHGSRRDDTNRQAVDATLDALWVLTRTTETTVVAVLHEVTLARRYADRVIEFP